MFMPRPDLGDPDMGRTAHDAEVERDRERNAAADAEAFDRGDGDLVHLLPGAGEPGAELQMPAQRPDVHGLARAALGILQIKAGAERLRPAR
jgi:hypothetical protein